MSTQSEKRLVINFFSFFRLKAISYSIIAVFPSKKILQTIHNIIHYSCSFRWYNACWESLHLEVMWLWEKYKLSFPIIWIWETFLSVTFLRLCILIVRIIFCCVWTTFSDISKFILKWIFRKVTFCCISNGSKTVLSYPFKLNWYIFPIAWWNIIKSGIDLVF